MFTGEQDTASSGQHDPQLAQPSLYLMLLRIQKNKEQKRVEEGQKHQRARGPQTQAAQWSRPCPACEGLEGVLGKFPQPGARTALVRGPPVSLFRVLESHSGAIKGKASSL